MKKIIVIGLLMIGSFAYGEKNASLTVMLDWFVNPQHAPIIVAQEKGFFKEQGLNVTIIAPADPADPPKLVGAGKADIAIDYQPELYLQVQEGLPIVRIGTLVDQPLRVIAVLQDSKINTLADLKGKTIAYSLSGVGHAIIQAMLQNAGLSLDDVTLINAHYDVVQALLAKKVDAISGVQRNFEIPEMALEGKPARAFYPEKYGVPPYDELIFVANKNNVNDPRYMAFMKAISQANAYIQHHPKESWQLLIKHHPELNNQLNKTAWKITRPDFPADPIKLDEKRYQDFSDWLVKMKLLQKSLSIKDVSN